MAPTTVKLRCDSEQLAHWKESAGKAGEDFSKWARRLLDESANGQHIYLKSEARASATAVELLDVVSAPRGDRRERMRTPGRFKQAVDVAHQVGRKTTPVTQQQIDHAAIEVMPEFSLVKHTAASNWLTCMCTTCVLKRQANDIPLGGMPPKKKGFKR